MRRHAISTKEKTLDCVRAPWRSATRGVDWRAASITCCVQIALFAALLSSITSDAAPTKSEVGNGGVSVFSVAQATEPARATPAAVDELIVPPQIVRVEIASLIATVEPQFTPAATVTQAQGQACDIASLVGNALAGSDDSLASIIAIDAAGLPVSRANMLWDGAWVSPASLLDTTPFSVVQQSVVQAITTAPPECQVEPITGPQFIMLDGVNAGRTIVLVIGSGSWSWNQLLPRTDPASEQFDGIWSSLSKGRAANNQPTA